MNGLKKIFIEIYRQLMNIPSFPEEKLKVFPETRDQLDYVNTQIERAVSHNTPIIFILGPFGSGKTTQMNYFFFKHPNLKKKWRSFVRINNLDFAFLHLTNYFCRFLVMTTGASFLVLLLYQIPFISALPILFLLAGFFTKSFGNLIYIINEVFDNIFTRSKKIIVIEDLERSSLSMSDQLAFLSNLWQNKRTYLVTLGYDTEEKQKALKLSEFALKLGGAVVEVPLNEEGNYEMISRLDPCFPFQYNNKGHEGWLSLFAFRELAMLKEQVFFRSAASKNAKEIEYVAVAFQFLLEKLKLNKQGLSFDKETREVKGFAADKVSPNQLHYLSSFFQSLDPSLKVINPIEQAEREVLLGAENR